MSNGQSTEHGYKVEARDANFHCFNPVALSDGILGPDWREVRFDRGHNPAGIPERGFGQKHEHGLLTHEGATALAWTLIAQNDLQQIECRLVRYKLETTYKCERSGVVDMPVIKNSMFRDVKLVDETAGRAAAEGSADETGESKSGAGSASHD